MKKEYIESAREKAEQELREERTLKAKEDIKEYLLKIEKSKKVTANLERELDELELELFQSDV